MRILALLLLASIPVSAGSWRLSLVVLGTAHAVDIHSSLGKMEANPLLRGPDGRFRTGRGIALKSAVVAGIALGQWALQRHGRRGLRKPFAVINYAAAIGIGGVAVRNYRVRE